MYTRTIVRSAKVIGAITAGVIITATVGSATAAPSAPAAAPAVVVAETAPVAAAAAAAGPASRGAAGWRTGAGAGIGTGAGAGAGAALTRNDGSVFGSVHDPSASFQTMTWRPAYCEQICRTCPMSCSPSSWRPSTATK